MADCKVRDVYTGIAGSHIKANSERHGGDQGREVTPTDIDRVIENTARAMPHPADQILHIPAQNSSSTARDGIREPIGMGGMRLEVRCTSSPAPFRRLNIVKCVRRCGW